MKKRQIKKNFKNHMLKLIKWMKTLPKAKFEWIEDDHLYERIKVKVRCKDD